MGRRVNSMIEGLLEALELIDIRVGQLEDVGRFLSDHQPPYHPNEEAHKAVYVLLGELRIIENRAMRDLLAAANLGTNEQREKAKKMAYFRYFKEGISKAHFLSREWGQPPYTYPQGGYLARPVDELEEELVELCGEGGPDEERFAAALRDETNARRIRELEHEIRALKNKMEESA